MKALGFLVGAFSIFCAVAAATTGQTSFYLVAGFGLAAAITTFLSTPVSAYLKIFIGIFSVETIVFGANALAVATKHWPESLSDFAMPSSLPVTAELFSILVYAVSFVPLVHRMTVIADRYFDETAPADIRFPPFNWLRTSERAWAVTMIVILVLINQVQVFLSILISFVSRDLFNAIQAYDSAGFWHQLLVVFPILASPYIISKVIEFLLQSALIIRWRRWLTDDYSARWLDGHNHYRMSLAGVGVDNPDQRISEDISRFIDGGQIGYGLYTFSVILISQLSTFVSFAILLWVLSADLTFPGTNIVIPGFLLWCALIYAAVGSLATHLIGRPLARLSFARQHYEANFRFSLARLREYSEQVALLAGEHNEKASLHERFKSVVSNYYSIVFVQARLMFFTAFFGQYSGFIPYAITAPFYFAKKIKLGLMQQVSRAFSEVNQALTFFITYYQQLAEYVSVLDRLSTFDRDLETGEAMKSFVRLPTPATAETGAAGRVAAPAIGREHHVEPRSQARGEGKRSSERARRVRENRPCSGRSPASGLTGTASCACRRTRVSWSYRRSLTCRSARCGQPSPIRRDRRTTTRLTSSPRSRTSNSRPSSIGSTSRTIGHRSCRAASSSGSPWPEPCWPSRIGCSWMRRPPPWIRPSSIGSTRSSRSGYPIRPSCRTDIERRCTIFIVAD